MVKLQQNENGEKEFSSLSVSQTLQIAGKFFFRSKFVYDKITYQEQIFKVKKINSISMIVWLRSRWSLWNTMGTWICDDI